MDITDWYRRTIGTDSHNAAAAKAHVNPSTVTRQLHDGRLGYDLIVPIARAYGADPIEGLIIAGLITQDDIDMHANRATLADATDAEIADEVWRRLTEGRAHPVFDRPMSGPAPEDAEGEVVTMRPTGRPVSFVTDEWDVAAHDPGTAPELEAWQHEATP